MVYWLSPRPDADAEVSVYRYLLPLQPAATGRATDRTGVLIRLVDEDGLVGWGEAAPLPGFSRESIDDILTEASEWAAGARDEGCATLAFAIDSATDDLEQRRKGEQQEAIDPRQRFVQVNTLIGGAGLDEREVMSKLEAGFRCFKMKVGAQPISEDIVRVRRLRALLPDDVELRLDANRAWSYDDAARFCEGIADLEIAYVEEPTKKSKDLPLLAQATPIPIALDETTRSVQPEALDSFGFAAAVILKPSLLGGMDVYQRWLAAARAHAMRVVLTGAYESGVATRRLVSLAASLDSATAHGLSTYQRLTQDVLSKRLPIAGTPIDVWEVERAGAAVDLDRIEHIETL